MINVLWDDTFLNIFVNVTMQLESVIEKSRDIFDNKSTKHNYALFVNDYMSKTEHLRDDYSKFTEKNEELKSTQKKINAQFRDVSVSLFLLSVETVILYS